MSPVATNLSLVRQQIAQICQQCGRCSKEVELLAVSKTRSVAEIKQAIDASCSAFGENYVQEALAKISQLSTYANLQWHFIGHIQSNKTRDIAEHFAWVHSIDRLKIAERLSQQRPASLPPLNICIEVNLDEEPQKAGTVLNTLYDLAHAIAPLVNLRLRGLMAMPAPSAQLSIQRTKFARLYKAFTQLNQQGFKLDTLSMGTTNDMQAAILEGATMLRIGTTIFGERKP